MKTFTLQEFCEELFKSYAVDCDGHIWSHKSLSVRNKDGMRWCDEQTVFNLKEISSFSIYSGGEHRLFVKSEDLVSYNESTDEYILIHNYQVHEDTGEKDDEGYTIYKNTGIWAKEPIKLIMLFRKGK
jgi:hypothetical protein